MAETKNERDTAAPRHPEVLPPSAIVKTDSVESAAMRARIESTPGGARYEEEAKKKAEDDGREYGLKPGIGRREIDPPKPPPVVQPPRQDDKPQLKDDKR